VRFRLFKWIYRFSCSSGAIICGFVGLIDIPK
jgi:hypothetical protein